VGSMTIYISGYTQFTNAIRNMINVYLNMSKNSLNIQEMIDFLVNWYELKYPDRLIQTNYGVDEPDFTDNPHPRKNMDYQALLYRLPYRILALIKNKYPRCLKIKLTFQDKLLPFYQFPCFYVMFDEDTGKFYNNGLEEYLPIENIPDNLTLETLCEFLKAKADYVDVSELENALHNREINFCLLKKLLELSALKMLYSKNTIPLYGYERAKLFINEFNGYISNLDLNTTEIDYLINQDYQNMFDDEFEEQSNSKTGIKTLVKSLFRK